MPSCLLLESEASLPEPIQRANETSGLRSRRPVRIFFFLFGKLCYLDQGTLIISNCSKYFHQPVLQSPEPVLQSNLKVNFCCTVTLPYIHMGASPKSILFPHHLPGREGKGGMPLPQFWGHSVFACDVVEVTWSFSYLTVKSTAQGW